jgi:hypothetical protein
MTVEEFRAAFPQFTAELYPDGRVQFYLTLASKQLNPARWEELLPEGTALFVAHYLTLEKRASQSKDGAGSIEVAAGPVIAESKTVGGVSVSKSKAGSAATGDVQAGLWNDTHFGKQFYGLVKIVGAGGAVV